MIAFPPHRTKVSHCVSKETALAHLSAYLTSSETQPHLLPNAHLDPSAGPTIRSSNFSVTIHNLRRVEAGLRGEILAPLLDLTETTDAFSASQKIVQDSGADDIKQYDAATTVVENEDTKILHCNQSSEPNAIPNLQINNTTPSIQQTSSPRRSHVDKVARKRDKKLRRKALKKNAQTVVIDP